MTYKTFIAIFISILIALNIYIDYEVLANEKKVLIIYNSRNEFGSVHDGVNELSTLLGRFEVDVYTVDHNSYKEGLADEYDYVFFLGLNSSVNNKVIFDLHNYEGELFWLWRGVDKFLKVPYKKIEYVKKKYNFKKVLYKNKNYKPAKQEEFMLSTDREFIIIKGQSDKKYGGLSDGHSLYPYIIKKNNFWYAARYESNTILFYILADVLQDFFKVNEFDENMVYVRIEDVHPFRDTKKLKEIGEFLNSRKIPFMIALIPAFRAEQNITTISDVKEFADTMRYLQNLGGSIILHGFTHEHFGDIVSGEGFEFWDAQNNKPPNIDMEHWVYNRIGLGLKEALNNGLLPLAFESSHYAISQQGYKEVKKYFSTYIGHLQSSDMGYSTTTYPYKITDTELFNIFIPENLGYINTNNEFTVEEIIDNYKKVSIVRGNIAGFYYHSDVDMKYLKEVINRLGDGIKYYDIRTESNWVKYEDISIVTKNGKIITNFDSYTKADIRESKNSYFSLITDIVIIIVIITILVFIIIFALTLRKNRKKYR